IESAGFSLSSFVMGRGDETRTLPPKSERLWLDQLHQRRHSGGNGVAAHEFIDARLLPLEIGEVLAGELAVIRHLDRHRVHVHAVDQHLEMTMRPGGETCGADVTDDLPLPHPYAGA